MHLNRQVGEVPTDSLLWRVKLIFVFSVLLWEYLCVMSFSSSNLKSIDRNDLTDDYLIELGQLLLSTKSLAINCCTILRRPFPTNIAFRLCVGLGSRIGCRRCLVVLTL